MSKTDGVPFDPKDPLDSASEFIKQRICEALIVGMGSSRLGALGPGDQMSAIMVGTLTALCGTMFLMSRDDAHADVMEAITEYLPFARRQAEGIIREHCHDR